MYAALWGSSASGPKERAESKQQKPHPDSTIKDEVDALRSEVAQLTSVLQSMKMVLPRSRGTTPRGGPSAGAGGWPRTAAGGLPSGRPGHAGVMPSVPSTPAHSILHDRHNSGAAEDEVLSIYSSATTTASQPAAYLDRPRPMKLPLATHGLQHGAEAHDRLPGADASAAAAAAVPHLPLDLVCGGMPMAAEAWRTVAASSGGIQPWLNALMRPAAPAPTPAAPPPKPLPAPAGKPTTPTPPPSLGPQDADQDVVRRRATRDQGPSGGGGGSVRGKARGAPSASLCSGSTGAATGLLDDDDGLALSALLGGPGLGAVHEGGAAAAASAAGGGGSPQLLACVALMAACQQDDGARAQALMGGALPFVAWMLRVEREGAEEEEHEEEEEEGERGREAAQQQRLRVAAHLMWFLSRSAAAGPAVACAADWAAAARARGAAAPAAVAAGQPGRHLGEVLVRALEAASWRVGEDAHTCKACALALNNLAAQSGDVQAGAVEAGAVPALVGLLACGDSVAEAAATALLGLTSGAAEEEDDDDEEDAGEAPDGQHCAVPAAVLACWQLVDLPDGVQACLDLLRYGDPLVQDSLAGLLQNVTRSVDVARAKVLVACGCVPALLEAARCGSLVTQEGAISALGNIAAETAHMDALVSAGAVEILSYLLSLPLPPVDALLPQPAGGGAAALAQLAGGAGAPLTPTQQLQAQQQLRALQQAVAVQAASMLALRNLCTGPAAVKQAVLQRGGVAALLAAAQGPSHHHHHGAGLGAAGAAPDDDGLLGGGLEEEEDDDDDDVAGSADSEREEDEGDGGEGGVLTREGLEEHEAELQQWALAALLSLSTEPAAREGLVLRGRVAPALLGVLLGGAPYAKELAAKVLTNLAIPDRCKSVLVAQGAALVLVPLVRNGTKAGKQAACRALQNLARWAPNRAEIASCGAVPALLDQLSVGEAPVFEAAAACLHTLCNHLQVIDELVKHGGARALLASVRTRQFVATRGLKLMLRLLHRLTLLHPPSRDAIAAEIALLYQ